MIKNYLTTALRRFRRNKAYAAINVVGLALGLACCLLIAAYVRHELSYDTYHEHADRVYLVARTWYDEGGAPTMEFARISAPIGPALEAELPDVEIAARIMPWDGVVERGARRFEEDGFFFVEPGVFELFTIPFERGDPATALEEPNTVVLTTSMAEKYFPCEYPIGKSLRFEGEEMLRVTGVVEDAPPNTHFPYDFLASFATIEQQAWWPDVAENWGGFNNFATYVRLPEGTDAEQVEAKLATFMDRHYTLHIGAASEVYLQPLPDIHLHSQLDMELAPTGSFAQVLLLIGVALLVLCIAGFNYVNLATARAATRAREVGVRKTLGAGQRQLVRQFLGEATMTTALAMAGALLLARALLPAFRDFVGAPLALFGEQPGAVALVLLGSVLVVGLAAGSYPAFFLARFQPATILKTDGPSHSGHARFRKGLVVVQFVITIGLLIGVGAMHRQMEYVQTKRLGFDAERLVTLPMTEAMAARFADVRARLEAHPQIERVTASQLVPSDALVNAIDAEAEVGGRMQPVKSLPLLPVDHAFFATYGIEVVAGRDFDRQRASDSTQAFVLNETAVRQIGWASPEAAIGKTFQFNPSDTLPRRGNVIGVVEDVHFESLHERIAPMVFFVMPERFTTVTARVATTDLPETLAFLEAQWTQLMPEVPFEYAFLDQAFDALYRSERRMGQIFGYFTGLAVVIACLGLFGVATYMAEQRTKEIGIRKALGATAASIVALLMKEVVWLVGLAFVVAVPLGYVGVQQWLAEYAYHTTLGPGLFVTAGTLGLVVALLAVSTQAFRAARTDPVKALHTE